MDEKTEIKTNDTVKPGGNTYYGVSYSEKANDYKEITKPVPSKKFQVFISFKNQDELGRQTKESAMASELYNALMELGINTFFSNATLELLGVAQYKTMIDEALDQCKVLIAVGTDVNNLNSHWVKYEWDSFYNDMLSGLKKDASVFSYIDVITPQMLPRTLRQSQVFEKKTSTVYDICTFVRNALYPEQKAVFKDYPGPVQKNVDRFSLNDLWVASKKYIKDSFMCFYEDENIIDEKTAKYSALFLPIIKLKCNDNIVPLSDNIIKMMSGAVVGSGNINVMKIVGGTGADKNALIELIYFNILKDALAGRNNLLPFYINLSYYEKIDYDKNDDYAAQIKKIIIEDIKVFTSLIEKYSDKTPILFIDGIREFILSKTSIEHVLSEVVAKIPNLKKVVSLDIDFTSNKNRIKKYIPFAPSNFEYIVKVAAVDLLDEELCERYFAAFENLYGIKVSDLYEKLLKFPFYEVDSYILRLAANILSDRSDNDTFSISDLYETMCFEMFNGNNDLLLEAAKTAYEFDYNDINFDDAEVFSSLKWKLIKRHRSFVDFLISYYYVYKLKEFKGEEDLPFFEMILPRQVTRFVIPRLNESYSHEENIIKMMRGYYDKMNNLGKGALVYWLGRLKNIKLSTEAKTILQSLYEEIKKKIREKDARHEYHDENERKNDLFILRGISLSLLYNGYEKISDEYIVSLIEDDLANKINRGFHLEYYGDKPYIPNKDMLDFEDKLDVGEKALKRLIKNIENNFKKGVSSSILESELFNMCSLIQARINCEVKINFALSPYVKKCIDFLAQYKNMVKRTNNKKILSYFDMIFDDFQSFLNDTNINNINCEIYNLFSTSGDVKRAGWVELDIEDPESIVEHMYNTWLLGMLNLPPDYYDEEYDKTKILNMIIIHDLGERVTGDISYLFKINDPSHEENEDYIMRTFLLKGTYPGMINLDYYYKLWEEWFEEKTLNSRIAHDIDKIQAIYQFCIYYSKYPEKFTEERKALWLIEYKNLKTEVGLDIYKRIILNNKNFQFLK